MMITITPPPPSTKTFILNTDIEIMKNVKVSFGELSPMLCTPIRFGNIFINLYILNHSSLLSTPPAQYATITPIELL